MSLSKWLLAASLVFAGSNVLATVFGYEFGHAGSSGQDGQSGYDGRSGQPMEVTATGQSYNFDLRGDDGRDGSNGSQGDDATSCYQDREAYDEYGAPGGNGGDGGRAGNGGNGGSIRVYYEDIANIKSIFVDSTPGRAAYPGDGARGGNGCRCSDYSWERKVCHQETRRVQRCNPYGCSPGSPGCTCRYEDESYEVCDWRTFNCRDGSDGRDGSSGSRGSDGSMGKIELIPRLKPLEEDFPTLYPPVTSLVGENFVLTRHEWDSRVGAPTLFAQGSRIRSNYSLYAGKTVKTVSFDWKDKTRDVDYYPNEQISLYVVDHPATVQVDFPSSILAQTKIVNTQDHTTVNVYKTMKRSELAMLRVDEMYGSNQDLTLVLNDAAKVSDAATTKIYIESGWDLEGGGEYKNWVPAELIRSEEGKVHINIGRLPGIKASKIKKYFGDKCEFEMQVVREFVGTSVQLSEGKYNILDIEKDVKNKKPIQVKWED